MAYGPRMATDAEREAAKAAIAAKLLAIRKQMGLDQDEFAQLVGKARSQYLSYEHAKVWMGKEVREQIAKRLKIKPEELGEAFNKYAERPYMRRKADPRNLLDDTHEVGGDSYSPYSGVTKGAEAVADAALFRKLMGYWAAMEPAQRQELVSTAWRMSSPDTGGATQEARAGQRRHG